MEENIVIEGFQCHYDCLVKKWLDNPKETLENQEYYKVLKKKYGKCDLSYDGLPEPYLRAPKNCTALIININPGRIIPANNINKLSAEDNMIQKYLLNGKNSRYRELAEAFPYLKGIKDEKGKPLNWWILRKDWLSRFKEKEEKVKICALELCPWHSNKWHAPSWSPDLINEVKEFVLKPACAIIAHNKLQYGFIIGKAVCNTFMKIGGKEWKYVMICEVTKDNKDNSKEVSLYNGNDPFSDKDGITLQEWQDKIKEQWPCKDESAKWQRTYAIFFQKKC